jgi:hypothetical protein
VACDNRGMRVLTPKPCARCKGSGDEPDPLAEALGDLTDVICGAQVTIGLRDDLARAASRVRVAAGERIGGLESLLAEILGHFAAETPGASHIVLQVPQDDVRGWRERIT